MADCLVVFWLCEGAQVEVTEEDERAIALFLAPPSEAPRQRTLADVIREKVSDSIKQETEAVSSLLPFPLLPSPKHSLDPAQAVDDPLCTRRRHLRESVGQHQAGD